MIVLKYNGPTLVKNDFWDNSANRFIERGTIINIRYIRVDERETTVFFAFPNEDIGHFATWGNKLSGGLQNIFNILFISLVN